MKLSPSGKAVVVFLLIGAFAVGLFCLVLSGQIRESLFVSFEEEMTQSGRIIAMMPQEKIISTIDKLARACACRLTLINAAGRVVVDTMAASEKMDSYLHHPEMQEARLRGVGTARRYSTTLRREMIYVVIPLGNAKSEKGYLLLSRPAADVSLFADRQARTSLYFMLVLIIAYLLTALLICDRLLAPIRRMTAFTSQVRGGNFSGTLLVQSDGEIAELTKNINNMVESLKEKIQKADEEKNKLESVFAGMNEGVMLLDSENKIESVNPSMERILRRPSRDMIGRTILEVCHNAELHDALAHLQQTKGVVCKEINLGEEASLVMDVTISAVDADKTARKGTILVFHDVTHLKKLERVRTDFIANATHEIRTPLTAIIGFTETLQHGVPEDSETAKKFLGTIRENAERLNRLVDDLKTLSSLELGEENLKLEELSIKEEIQRVLHVVGGMASQKGIAVHSDIPEDFPMVFADKDRMMQILINVLDNAIKFTPDGGLISIAAFRDGEFLAIKIADNGPGIPAADIPRLGERFFRVDKTRSRDLGGTGLGLSIVKHLMKAHKGRMEIQSVLGSGTAVLLFFPVAKKPV